MINEISINKFVKAIRVKQRGGLKGRSKSPAEGHFSNHKFYIIVKFYRRCGKKAYLERKLQQFINRILRNSLRELHDVNGAKYRAL